MHTTPNDQGDNAILNMFQWTWNSIAAECTNVIGPAGFAYVQVSPPQEHIIGVLGAQGAPWWTSYQPVSYKVESKLGTRAEFATMVQTCRDAGVGIIADAVINHMTGQTEPGIGWAGTEYSEENYPGPEGGYGPQDFNECKTEISNYGDRHDVQNCRLVGLQDLATGSDYVQQEIADYLDDLASLGVAGYRIDAAKHMPAADLEAIKSKTTAAKNLYWVHEVIGSGGEPIQPVEYLGSGDSHEFNYGRTLQRAFNGRISTLQRLATNQDLLEGYRAGVFVDNHDTERNRETLSYHAGNKYLLANVFLFSYPYGSPSAYTGYEFEHANGGHDIGAPQDTVGKVLDAECSDGAFTCIHREPEIANMVGFYNDVRATGLNNWQTLDGGNVVGYGRGEQGFVVLNNTNASVNHTFTTSLPQGSYCNVIAAHDLTDCDETFTVGADGSVDITAAAGKSVVLWTKHSTRTGDPVYANTTTTVYFHKYSGWAEAYLHHNASGGWTQAPGDQMSEVCEGWYAVTVPTTGPFVGVLTNGAGDWNNPMGGGNYNISGEHVTLSHGVAVDANPCGSTDSQNIVVYYRVNPAWTTHNIHYGHGIKGWTAVPGERMSPACEGWVRKTIATDGDELEFVFNNGGDTWDNPEGGGNYSTYGPVVAVDNKVMTEGNPCAGQEELPEEEEEPVIPEAPEYDTVRVFLAARDGWATHNLHYGAGSEWTAVPGAAMNEVCAGWFGLEVNARAGLKGVFNSGGTSEADRQWLNAAGGGDFDLNAPIIAVAADMSISQQDPCIDDEQSGPGNGDGSDGGGSGTGNGTDGNTDSGTGDGETGSSGSDTGGNSGTGNNSAGGGENPDATDNGTGVTDDDVTDSSQSDQNNAQTDETDRGVAGDALTTDEDQNEAGELSKTGTTLTVFVLTLSVVLLAAGIAAIVAARRMHTTSQ
jgi:alpha-amylase